MRVSGCGLVAALAALGAIGCGSGVRSAVPPTPAPLPVVDVEAVRPQVAHFCGNCHGTPQPQSFPRDRWPHEVDRGYEFYVLSGRSDLKVPKRADVVAYYEQLAPDKLEVPLPPPADKQSRFQRLELTWPRPLTDPLGVANLLGLAPTPNPAGKQFVLCDMRSGAVTWAAISPSLLEVVRETKLNNPDHACATDLDGDGRTDYVICDLGSFLPEDHDRGRVVWLRPTSDDPAAPFEQIALLEGVGRVADAQVADFDGDKDLDVVVAVFGWHSSGSVTLLRQEQMQSGRPRFAAEVLDEREGAIHVPVADLNGDSRPDFVALFSQEHESVEAFLNRGDGKFDKQVIYQAPDPSYGSSGIELVDFDGDADLDVIYTNGDTFDSFYVKPYHSIRWIENQGGGIWKDRLLANLPGVHRARAADLDGDGDLDLAACCFVSTLSLDRQPEVKRFVSVGWLERQDDRFVLHEIEANDPVHATLELADLNGDAQIDILVGNFGKTVEDGRAPVSVWLNQARP